MYQVMIVDDEEPVLDSFAFIMEQGVDNFTLCARARSGVEAVQKARQFKPDLIFMDIQMPGIDGLEAIEEIKQINSEILFILSTAYERFDIARRAIKLNVLSYLVKPVTRKKILQELARAGEILDKRNQERERVLELTSPRERAQDGGISRKESDFVHSLNSPISLEKWRIYQKEMGFAAERGAVCILEERESRPMAESQDFFIGLKEKIQFKYLCYLAFSGSRAVFFFPEEENLDELYPRIKSILRDISAPSCQVVPGGIYPLEEMVHSYEEAMQPFLLDQDDSRLLETEQLYQILSLVDRGEKESFIGEMKYLAASVFSSFSFPVALGKMTSVFVLILVRLGYFTHGQDESLPLLPAEEIMVLENREEWDTWFHHGLDRITAVMTPKETAELPAPLQKAVEHINRSYGEQIYLGSVAEICGVSASYLSRLFSEHMGCPFTDYLNRKRVDRAAELLTRENLSVKEAAYQTGFADPNYFSKIFRKYKGMSPSEL